MTSVFRFFLKKYCHVNILSVSVIHMAFGTLADATAVNLKKKKNWWNAMGNNQILQLNLNGKYCFDFVAISVRNVTFPDTKWCEFEHRQVLLLYFWYMLRDGT